MVFGQNGRGGLSFVRTVPTGGVGLGTGLGSQGAVSLIEDQEWLFVVNSGSDDVPVFRVEGGNLVLVDRESSGGDRPVSVTVHKCRVYVLNQGAGANISAFSFRHGNLEPLDSSTRPLSGDYAVGSQVQFTPDIGVLVITERGINRITTSALGRDDVPDG